LRLESLLDMRLRHTALRLLNSVHSSNGRCEVWHVFSGGIWPRASRSPGICREQDPVEACEAYDTLRISS
jgi:hypothetical protein